MKERYFDHDADIGVAGRGATPEAAMEDAAAAMFALATDPAGVGTSRAIAFDFEEADPEIAFVRWLNLLLAHAADEGLALAHFRLRHEGTHWHGEARGERWRPGLERGTDVKGATLTMLSVAPVDGAWEARCVVDV